MRCYVAGKAAGEKEYVVKSPYSSEAVGSVTMVRREQVEQAIRAAISERPKLTRFQRYEILNRAGDLLAQRKEDFALGITRETGLCIRESRYEVGRSQDVLRFCAIEALRDDGQIFSCDISPQGKPRKIFTTREPLKCAVAITPFNHPLNQVAHKVGPAISIGTPMILKPSEKAPLTAIKFAELLYETGLPGPMLSVLLGPTADVAENLVRDERIEVVAFTGSVAVGKKIAQTAGYKKFVLELGGNDPLIVLKDADLNLAVLLAAEGSYRNSGQRCTAIKRILVEEPIADRFAEALAAKTKEYICGDPENPETRVGTVIDENAAIYLENVLKQAVSDGAKILIGGRRRGALFEPAVIDHVPRTTPMVVCESFGPLAPIIRVKNFDDAIAVANSAEYGLSSGVVTNNLDWALRAVRELKCGTVNVNEVPGFRVENSPFGGIKDSGMGIKEGVIESIKNFSYVKTFSLPW